MNYKVSVVVTTYLQEEFILDTLNSIFNQKSNFLIELIISNDASNDNTDQLIKDFLINNNNKNITVKYTCQDTNIGMMPNFIYSISQAQGEYIAICEGDDYWIDDYKLQKQADFLDKYDDVSYVFSDYNVVNKHNQQIKSIEHKLPISFDLNFLLKSKIMPCTPTIIFRKNKLPNEFPPFMYKCFNGDWVLLFLITQNSNIGYLNSITSNYRGGVGIKSKSNKLYVYFDGINTNKHLNRITNYKYDWFLSDFDYHYKYIAYAYLENKKYIKGIYWSFVKLTKSIFNNNILPGENYIFIKHIIKISLIKKS